MTPSRQLAVSSGNGAVMAASLLGRSPEKLHNHCLLTLRATWLVPLENCANLVVQPLLAVRSGKCAEHACLALLQPRLSLPKFE